MMCVGRMPRSSTKISVVARVASKRVNLQQCAHDSFRHAFFAGPAHQTALAPWAHVPFARVQKTHFRTSLADPFQKSRNPSKAKKLLLGSPGVNTVNPVCRSRWILPRIAFVFFPRKC